MASSSMASTHALSGGLPITMATSVTCRSADRSYTESLHHSAGILRPEEPIHVQARDVVDRAITVALAFEQPARSLKRRAPTTFCDTSMPAATGSQSMLASLPSFMSVFGDGVDNKRTGAAGATQTLNKSAIDSRARLFHNNSFPTQHLRHDSSSTFGSTDSSPTTTISTLDSAITEPSPNSSPESPNSALPHSSFYSSRAGSNLGVGTNTDMAGHRSRLFPASGQPESPQKRMRNMKNLSLDTDSPNKGIHLPALAISSMHAVGSHHTLSAPTTPGFIVPPKPGKRKPSSLGLSITTADATAPAHINHHVPPMLSSSKSESQTSTIKHLQAHANMPLFSPTLAPEGGMRLPPFGSTSISSHFPRSRPPLSMSHQSYEPTNLSPVGTQMLDYVMEENDYSPSQSREVNSPGYPHGPVCIYDPFVYLYLEPTITEASEFDVVINVAREVLSPFTTAANQPLSSPTKDVGVQVSLDKGIMSFESQDAIPEPQTAVSEKSFGSAFEIQPQQEGLKIFTSKPSKQEPEYIHVPWDHNTNVVNDLAKLCETIDKRIKEEKKVLVHCQQGVSRSASLIVAYGLYKNPELSVQDAYDAVKNRSQWIGPNMNLIYQLSEFKAQLAQKQAPVTATWRSRFSLKQGRSNTTSLVSPGLRPAPISIPGSQREPLSAPLSMDQDASGDRRQSLGPPGAAQIAEVVRSGGISPGPSSAPPDMQWSPTVMPVEKQQSSANPGDNETDRHASLATLAGMMSIDSAAKGANTQMQEVALDEDVKSKAVDREILAPSIYVESAPKEDDTSRNAQGSTEPTRSNGHPVNFPPKPAIASTIQFPSPQSPQSTTSSTLSPSPFLPSGFTGLSTRRHIPLHIPLPPSPRDIESTMHDIVPSTPSVLSPRAAEFTASPFHRTAAGDLAGSSVFEQGRMSPRAQQEDPRSPAQRGEAPITRSIFDVI